MITQPIRPTRTVPTIGVYVDTADNYRGEAGLINEAINHKSSAKEAREAIAKLEVLRATVATACATESFGDIKGLHDMLREIRTGRSTDLTAEDEPGLWDQINEIVEEGADVVREIREMIRQLNDFEAAQRRKEQLRDTTFFMPSLP